VTNTTSAPNACRCSACMRASGRSQGQSHKTRIYTMPRRGYETVPDLSEMPKMPAAASGCELERASVRAERSTAKNGAAVLG
jgi:hypothetical protein